MREIPCFNKIVFCVCVYPPPPYFDVRQTTLCSEHHFPEQVTKLSTENEAEAQLSKSGQHNLI